MRIGQTLIFVSLALVLSACSDSPQQADPDFKPKNGVAHFLAGTGPVVLVDEAHHNFLTASGRYKPFAQVLISDGFRVSSNTQAFTNTQLKNADIVVIANALDRNRKDWLPPYRNAFDQSEVEALTSWVQQGGSLFLVADHAPFPEVIKNLSLALRFQFSNGHVANAIFNKDNQLLAEHPVTYRRDNIQNDGTKPLLMQGIDSAATEIRQVRSFGGSAFKAPENAISVLNLGIGAVSIEPEIPFQINSSTPRISVNGWSQGALLELGEGRVAVFSEGMMFSSQIDTTTGKKYGLGSVGAEQNEAFLLNVMHWLANTNR